MEPKKNANLTTKAICCGIRNYFIQNGDLGSANAKRKHVADHVKVVVKTLSEFRRMCEAQAILARSFRRI
jgi:hypothetical protein